MAEFPWAEANPMQASEQASYWNMLRDAFQFALAGTIPGAGGLPVRGGAGGFARLRVPRGPRPEPELATLLKELGGKAGPSVRPRPSVATARTGRNPAGRPDLPSEELMPSLESPSGRRGFGRL